MKVLHVIPSLDPATGGPPMVATRMAAAQAALGCQMQVVSYRFPKAQDRIDAAIKTIPDITSVKLQYLPPLTKPERFLASGARRTLRSVVGEFDLIHLHGVWDPLIHVVATLATAAGKPFVLTPHGMLDPWAMSQRWWKKRAAMVLGYRRMLNNAAFLHFLNADECTLTTRLHLTSPSRILPNGIFLQELDPLPEKGAFRATHSEFAKSRLVLFLSRLHYKKGLDFLADAFAIVAREFPDAQLIVAGPDDGARAPFLAQIARLDIARRVHLVGPLYAAQKIAALRDCDCFCLPSRQEGFSLAVTEAMACESPVVISTECHFPEVAEAAAGVVVQLNAQAVAAGIQTVLRDPAAAAQMGRAGRALVISRFTWPKVAQQMIGNYQQVLTGQMG
ncbi:MAG TPA: glycosyltransferase [Tepidisphaeraceae bacterium]|jgi:glycosyltransferase involved in cell wall biosynthesis|nr:glycosyltransferase [Tepidisphaeraceae bacterium]